MVSGTARVDSIGRDAILPPANHLNSRLRCLARGSGHFTSSPQPTAARRATTEGAIMQRFAVLFLLSMGILTAGRSWAGQMDSTGETTSDPPKSTDPALLPSENAVVAEELPEEVLEEFT